MAAVCLKGPVAAETWSEPLTVYNMLWGLKSEANVEVTLSAIPPITQ